MKIISRKSGAIKEITPEVWTDMKASGRSLGWSIVREQKKVEIKRQNIVIENLVGEQEEEKPKRTRRKKEDDTNEGV